MSLVTSTTADGVRTIVMDDGKANALSHEMFAALNTELDQAEADASVVLLAGRPGRFSGGFHLATLTSLTPSAADLLRAGFELSHRLLSFPRPVVLACTGHAYAMGSFLLLSVDHRVGIAGGDHRITANEVAIGMPLPRAATEICRQRLTPAAFSSATALATIFSHDEAVAAGWLDEVVPEDDLLRVAAERAAHCTTLDAEAHVRTKLRARASALEAIAAGAEQDDVDFRTVIAAASTA
jgi:enoyl-CoA hydratase